MKALRGSRHPSGPQWYYGDTFPATIPEYDRGALVLGLARQYHASGIIALGMASDKRVPTIELEARNQNDSRYCPLEYNLGRIDTGTSERNRVRVNLHAWNTDRFIRRAVDANLAAPAISADAGGFCCNHLIYQMWHAQQRQSESARVPWIFLHIPCSPEAVSKAQRAEFDRAGKVHMQVETIIRYIHLLVASAELPDAEKLYPTETAAV